MGRHRRPRPYGTRHDHDGLLDDQDRHCGGGPPARRRGQGPSRRRDRSVSARRTPRRQHHRARAPVTDVGAPQSDPAALGSPRRRARAVRRGGSARPRPRRARPSGVRSGDEVRLLEHFLLVARPDHRAVERPAVRRIRHGTRAGTARPDQGRARLRDSRSCAAREGLSRQVFAHEPREGLAHRPRVDRSLRGALAQHSEPLLERTGVRRPRRHGARLRPVPAGINCAPDPCCSTTRPIGCSSAGNAPGPACRSP